MTYLRSGAELIEQKLVGDDGLCNWFFRQEIASFSVIRHEGPHDVFM